MAEQSPYRELLSQIAQLDANVTQARHAAGGDIPEVAEALNQMSAMALTLSKTVRGLDVNAQMGMVAAQAPQAPVNPGYERPPVDEAAFAQQYPDLYNPNGMV